MRAQSLVVTRKLQSELTRGFSDDEVETVARFFSSILERFGREPTAKEPRDD